MNLQQQQMESGMFRELYAGEEPAFELIDGIPEQKALPTRLHSALQAVIREMLKELGYRAFSELTLTVSRTWEPIPDVTATICPYATPYQDVPPAVVVEILSPGDTLTLLARKCRKYADWNIPDILVFDPIERVVYRWASGLMHGLIEITEDHYRFTSLADAAISFPEVWRRLDEELG